MPSTGALSMPRITRHRPLLALAPLAALVAALLVAVLVAAAPARAGQYGGEIAFGPLGTLKSLGNVDLAPDGSGAIVYTVEEAGADRVFVSRLINGAWQRTERVDGGLSGPSSQPVVSAGDGGRVTVAFANGGNIYAVTRPSLTAPWATQQIWGSGGASDPHVDLSVNRKGYLAFTAPGGGGRDVRVAYSKDAGPWALIPTAFDANAGAEAGAGPGRPRVGSSADGVAVIVWGEAGRVFARRAVGTRPSVVVADATAGAQLEGLEPISSDLPEVGIQDDDSFTGVAFRANYAVGDAQRSRVVYRRLRGSRFEGTTAIDANTFATGQGSAGPKISTNGIGQGLVTGTNDATNLTFAMPLRADVTPGAVAQVDSVAQSTAPTFAVPIAATAQKMLVAWQYTDPSGATDVRGRFFNGRDFEPEQVLSVPALGPTQAARGLDAAADDNGDIVVAWIQEIPGRGPAIAVSTIDQPPGRFAPKARRTPFERTDRPVLEWSASREAWGAQYKVSVDGVEIATTPRTSFRVKTALAQGVHTWQVTVVDRRGQTYAAKAGTVTVDSIAPTARLRVSGARRPEAALRLALTAQDLAPPPAAGARPARTSGVAGAIVDWGDRSRRERIRTAGQHVYARAGRYTVRVTVTDKAGNTTVARQVLKIVAPRARRGRGRAGGRGGARA